MRAFFFSTMKDGCGTGCRWQTCPQRYLAALRKLDDLCALEIFGAVPLCVSPIRGKSPKNGDLVILYAKDSEDLDAIVGTRESFDGLRKILVVADSAGIDDKKYHLLEPRYITQAGRNIAELEAVIHKMTNAVQ